LNATSIKLSGGSVCRQTGKLSHDRAQFLGALIGFSAVGD
jgi:hypothetical protein